MPAFIDLTGIVFDRLTVLEPIRRRWANGASVVYWRCRCLCGRERVIRAGGLRSGHHRSCGCLRNELSGQRGGARFTKHGRFGTPEYNSWRGMGQRCYRINHPQYQDYGGRGISVCDRWRSFTNFYADMGPRPVGMTLDRIDVNGNYEPANCRWAYWNEQRLNQRQMAA